MTATLLIIMLPHPAHVLFQDHTQIINKKRPDSRLQATLRFHFFLDVEHHIQQAVSVQQMNQIEILRDLLSQLLLAQNATQ